MSDRSDAGDAFWNQITAWVAGTSSLDEFVATIDEAIANSNES